MSQSRRPTVLRSLVSLLFMAAAAFEGVDAFGFKGNNSLGNLSKGNNFRDNLLSDLFILVGFTNPISQTVIATGNATSYTAQHIPNMPNSPFLDSVSCSDEESPFCIIGGMNHDDTQISYKPILLNSDGINQPWNLIDLNIKWGYFNDAACFGKNQNATCIAVGQQTIFYPDGTEIDPPLIVSIQNRGSNITVNNFIPLGGSNSDFLAVDCAADACAAVGLDNDPDFADTLLLYSSVDNLQTWNRQFIQNHYAELSVYSTISCFAAPSTICVIAGYELRDLSTIANASLAVSSDALLEIWKLKPVANIPRDALYLSSSCTNNICVLGGVYDFNSFRYTFLVASIDNAETWSRQNVAGLENAPASINDLTCVDSDFSSTCIAVTSTANIIATINKGKTWSLLQVPGMPKNTILDAAACATDGTCIIAGTDADHNAVLAVSTDILNNWKLIPRDLIVNLPPKSGFAAATALSTRHRQPVLSSSSSTGSDKPKSNSWSTTDTVETVIGATAMSATVIAMVALCCKKFRNNTRIQAAARESLALDIKKEERILASKF